MRKKVFSIILTIFLISCISAYSVNLNPNSFSKTLKEGEIITQSIDYSITNSDSTTTSPIQILTSNIPFVLSTPNTIDPIPPNSTITGTILLTISPEEGDVGNYVENIYVGTKILSANVEIEKDQTGECRLIELPHTSSFILEQGETSTTPVIKVRASSQCPNLIFNSIAPQTQMIKPMFIQSEGESEEGKEYSFSIGLNGEEVSKGSYQNKYVVSAYSGDSIYTKDISLSTTITSGVSPLTNSSFDELPSCSLSASEFKLNNTYKLICSTVLNLDIVPTIDSNYIEGKSVEETDTQYIYSFKPKQIGNTVVCSKFLFNNAEIGSRFCQEVKIFQGSQPIGGTNLKFKFYPDLFNVDGNVTIRVLDNQSNQLIEEAKLYLDGILVNNELFLKKGKKYELRASSYGYNDLIKEIEIGNKPINFTLMPNHNLGDQLNFTYSPSDASVYLNDLLINLPYTLNNQGVFQITLKKDGYSDTSKNITVESSFVIKWSTPDSEVKKGKEILVEFEKDGNYTIQYQNLDGEFEFIEPLEKDKSDGVNSVRFEVEGYGNYYIYSDGKEARNYVVSKPDWWRTWWAYCIYGIAGIIFLIIVFSGNKPKSDSLELMRSE